MGSPATAAADSGAGVTTQHSFGTWPVFLASVCTILGAILFLRFGYAVGHAGMLGAIGVVLLGHLITIPTALAVSEIATNLKVEGGGEYFIISRSFGPLVGGAIGVALYLGRAISVAFYLIAFSEAFRPAFPWLEQFLPFTLDVQMISIPAAVILIVIIALKGAHLGVGLLGLVFAVLVVAIGMFFFGSPLEGAPMEVPLLARVEGHDGFFTVFAIIFPAFTGMTAGLGLSGDLRNPRKSLPLGTMAAVLVGMVVYLGAVVKFAAAAPPDRLAGDMFAMADIALWGPIIPIGLAAGTFSSAIGSILVAPRMLQAIAHDKILPMGRFNRILSRGSGEGADPANATWLTAVIVLTFVSLGDIDFVAKIISMFFMIAYGALCTISFLEHFAGNPSYRPTFRTSWWTSLAGALAAAGAMFFMSPLYATISIVAMGAIYFGLMKIHAGERNLATVVRGVLYQVTRMLQLVIQKQGRTLDRGNWRPSFIAISGNSLERVGPYDLMRWISHHYGFGSYIHFLRGPLTVENHADAQSIKERLIEQTESSGASIYVDTIISPSFRTAVAQTVQLPGIAGLENNSVLFDADPEEGDFEELIEAARYAAVAGLNLCVLRASERHFGYKRTIHVWLTPGDFRNANLMILLSYILAGHPEWRGCEIKLFAAFHPDSMEEETARLTEQIRLGRIPIAESNVVSKSLDENTSFEQLVNRTSGDCDLLITGFSLKKAVQDKGQFFRGFREVQDILFVRASQEILITDPVTDPKPPEKDEKSGDEGGEPAAGTNEEVTGEASEADAEARNTEDESEGIADVGGEKETTGEQADSTAATGTERDEAARHEPSPPVNERGEPEQNEQGEQAQGDSEEEDR